MMKFYSQKDYPNVMLGTSHYSLKSQGCFVTSLAMLDGRTPPEVNKLLTEQGGFQNGCLLIGSKAADILGLGYDGRVTKDPGTLCIAETNHYKYAGIPQHFFVYENGKMADPLDQPSAWKDCKYNIVSYRLFGSKECPTEPICEINCDQGKELENALLMFKTIYKIGDKFNVNNLSIRECRQMGEKIKNLAHIGADFIRSHG